MEDLSFRITGIKKQTEYPLTIIEAVCVQDNMVISVELTDLFVKDKEFIKSLLIKEHNKKLEKEIEEIKIGEIL